MQILSIFVTKVRIFCEYLYMMDFDVVIVGGGVVGLACAEKLSGISKVLLIERNDKFGQEISSRNSEVIHAGIYYQPNSLKARLCVEGKKMLYQWCSAKNVPNKRLGKYIVATNEAELPKIGHLYRNASYNGVDDLEIVSNMELKQAEPNVEAISAIWSPSTGIVDTHELMRSFEAEAIFKGCTIAYKHEFIGMRKIENGYVVTINSGEDRFEITTRYLVNSAGLNSDKIAELAGIDIEKAGYKLNYCKGHYFRLNPAKNWIIKHLIYPVPPASGDGVGIHATIDIDGGIKFGPDIHYISKRELDYTVPEYLASKFLQSVRKYLPDIELDDLSPDQSGIRPKLQTEGGEFRDFIICNEHEKGLNGLINLIGIESPGLTSCMAIAEYVAGMIKD